MSCSTGRSAGSVPNPRVAVRADVIQGRRKTDEDTCDESRVGRDGAGARRAGHRFRPGRLRRRVAAEVSRGPARTHSRARAAGTTWACPSTTRRGSLPTAGIPAGSRCQEEQCRVHVSPYIYRGPTNLRIWEEKDPKTQDLLAIKHYHSTFEQTRTIWMDGRPHPGPNAAHTWMGFSTGRFDGDMLDRRDDAPEVRVGAPQRAADERPRDGHRVLRALRRHPPARRPCWSIPCTSPSRSSRARSSCAAPANCRPARGCGCATRWSRFPARRASCPRTCPVSTRSPTSSRAATASPWRPPLGGAATMYPEYQEVLKKLPKPPPLAAAAGRRDARDGARTATGARRDTSGCAARTGTARSGPMSMHTTRPIGRRVRIGAAVLAAAVGAGAALGGRAVAQNQNFDTVQIEIVHGARQHLHAGRRRRQHDGARRRRRHPGRGHAVRAA